MEGSTDSEAVEDVIEACEDDEGEGEGEGEGALELTSEDAMEMAHAITGIVGREVLLDE